MDRKSSDSSIYDHGTRFRSGVVIDLTLRCPLTCDHCTVSSSPERTEEFPLEQLTALIDDLGADPGVELVVFSGGEPFLKPDRLHALVEAATCNALKVEIVTSGYWARSPARACSVLEGLPPVNHISLSADKYHLPFVPLEWVRNAAEAALSLGIGVGVFVVLENGEDDFLDRLRDAMGNALLADIELLVESVHLAGRAARTPAIAEAVEWVSFDELPALTCEMPATPVIRSDGRVLTCCGDIMSDPENWPSLTYGNLKQETISDLLDRADRNPLTHALRVLGPRKLGEIANERAGRQLFTRLFEHRNICDICRAVTTDPEAYGFVNEYLKDPDVANRIAAMRLLRYGELPVQAEAPISNRTSGSC